jgi:hypothetical protein
MKMLYAGERIYAAEMIKIEYDSPRREHQAEPNEAS